MFLQRKQKRKTFNEVVPLNPEELETDFIGMLFQSVPEDFVNLLGQLFALGVSISDVYLSASAKFRTLYGRAFFSEEVLNNPYFQLVADENGVLSSNETQSAFFNLYFNRYYYKWYKLLKNVYSQTYNPIENYDRLEESETAYSGSENTSNSRNSSGTRSTQRDEDNTVTETDTSTESETANGEMSATNNTDNSRYGFNSANAVPTDEVDGTSNSQSETSRSVTGNNSKSVTGDNSITEGVTDSRTDTETSSRTFTNRKDNVTSRIHGNIGVLTNQSMLISELTFRIKNDFFDNVIEDVKNELIEKIY